MIVLQLFWLFVIVACLTFFFVFVNKTKSMFSAWRPFPVFAAVTILLNLCLYALVPVYSNNAWQNPKLVKCTETSSRNILALSFSGSFLYASLYFHDSVPARTHIFEYKEHDTVPAIDINDAAQNEFRYGNSSLQANEYTVGLAVIGNYIFAADDDPSTIGIYVIEKNLEAPSSHRFATLKHLPASIAVSAKYMYTSGTNYNHISQIKRPLNHSISEVAENEERDIFSFGAGGLNTFTNPRGLLFHDNVLYVCDNNRVLAFMESTAGHLILLKVFAPIHEPISLAVYKNTLAVTTRYYIFFYNLHTTIYLGSITQLGSFLITASRNYLYVADHSKICAYTQNSE